MSIYLMYIIILIISLLIIRLIKDKEKALFFLGKITIISSITVMSLITIAITILKNNINVINISTITNYLLKKYIKNSLYLILIGITEILLSKYVFKNKTIVNHDIGNNQ